MSFDDIFCNQMNNIVAHTSSNWFDLKFEKYKNVVDILLNKGDIRIVEHDVLDFSRLKFFININLDFL